MVVVAFTLVINTIVAKGPIVFLTLSEAAQGEIDAIITSTRAGSIDIGSSGFTTNGQYLNYTRFLELQLPENRETFDQDMTLYITPRKTFCGVNMGSD